MAGRLSASSRKEGISGAKGRDKRPAFDRLHKAIVRREIDLVAMSVGRHLVPIFKRKSLSGSLQALQRGGLRRN
jgi:hypothetical protein